MTEPRSDDQARNSSVWSEQPDEPSPASRDAEYFEEDDDAVSITSATPEAVGDQTRYSRTVGEGDGESFFAAGTGEEAEVQLTAIRSYCRNCPIRDHCPQEACAVYRAETTNLALAGRARDAYAGVLLPITEDR